MQTAIEWRLRVAPDIKAEIILGLAPEIGSSIQRSNAGSPISPILHGHRRQLHVLMPVDVSRSEPLKKGGFLARLVPQSFTLSRPRVLRINTSGWLMTRSAKLPDAECPFL